MKHPALSHSNTFPESIGTLDGIHVLRSRQFEVHGILHVAKLTQIRIAIDGNMEASHNLNANNSDLIDQAEQAMRESNWPEALDWWKQWWGAFPDLANDTPDAMHDRAVCHFHCNEKESALEWLNHAATLQPDYGYRYSSRGWMKQAMGDLNGAINDYKKAVELDPEDAVTWNNLGLLEEQMGYRKEAKERYKVSDELREMLKERGIDPEKVPHQSPVIPPVDPTPKGDDLRTAQPKVWSEIKRAVWTKEGRKELWAFVRNGFTLGDS